jgi:hypothetical protein
MTQEVKRGRSSSESKKWVNPKASIVLESEPEIVPKGELPGFSWMQRAERVDVAQAEHFPIEGTRLGLKQGVLNPRGRVCDSRCLQESR